MKFEDFVVKFQTPAFRTKSLDDDVRRTTKAYLSYKLTKWAFGSGELKTHILPY